VADLAGETGMAAMELIRAAIEDRPGATVMDVVDPFLDNTVPGYVTSGLADLGLPYQLRQLIAVLAQLAAGSFEASQLAQARRPGMNKHELLSRLAEVEPFLLRAVALEEPRDT
jgi:hypothetical protein